MPTKYLCVHCDHRFDHEGEKKARCPKCMRVHGLEKISTADKSSGRPRWLVPAVVVSVLAAVVAGYAYWSGLDDERADDGSLAPLGDSALAARVRKQGASVGDLIGFLRKSDEIEAFAESAAGNADADDPVAAARAVVRAIRARASKQAFVPWSMGTPRATPLRNASRVVELIAEDGAREKLYPLEVAAFAVSALRSLDVDAMVAEAFAFPGDRSPPEPSGHFGYYVVAVYDGAVGEGEPTLLDPYAGRSNSPAVEDYRVLSDVEVVGAAVNHQAVYQLVQEGDQPKAFELSEAALKLDPHSAAVHTARGAIMLMLLEGGGEEGIAEFESALQIRPDAPRHNNLAAIALMRQDIETAEREVAAALEQYRDFAAGHATLAAIHLARRETTEAERELQTAERLDPDLHNLAMLWANYYLATGDTERAAQRALEAIEARQHDPQARLGAARLLRAAGRYDEMREQARAVMEMTPDNQRDRVRMVIEQLLGPTVFDEPMDEGDDVTAGSATDSPFQLDSDSTLLGGSGPGGPGAPSLLEEPSLLEGGGRPGGQGPSLLGDSQSDFQLRLNVGE